MNGAGRGLVDASTNAAVSAVTVIVTTVIATVILIAEMVLEGDDEEGEKKTGKEHIRASNATWHSESVKISISYPEKKEDDTPLQERLTVLANQISKLGVLAAVLTLAALLVKWGIEKDALGNEYTSADVTTILLFIIIAITIVVVAVPEGLPLAVTIALAYSMQKMRKDNNLVRHLAACETMGCATDICSDKTGTLTTNRMSVMTAMVGTKEVKDCKSEVGKKVLKKFAKAVIDRIEESIALNSTAFVTTDDETGEVNYSGSKTECALLVWCNEFFGGNYGEIRRLRRPAIVKVIPFSSENKFSAVIVRVKNVRKESDGDGGGSSKKAKKKVLYVKGAAESVFEACTTVLNPSTGGTDALDEGAKKKILAFLDAMAHKGLRTLCIAYRELLKKDQLLEDDADEVAGCLQKLSLLAVVGIKDPLRPQVPFAVFDCMRAGITVRMVTGDNIITACHIAKECGILTETGVALSGPDFRAMSDEDVDELIRPGGQKQLEVIARCSPIDKQRLVRRLRLQGRVVASTGDGTNDAPQLRLADVGFSMGIAGTEVAKEASDIILLDDNFASVVRAVIWGRNVFDAVRKFLQFQLTVNAVALLVSFVSSMYLSFSVLSAVQLLWLNLVMDTFGALALSTDTPTENMLDRAPAGRNEPLITYRMWRFIAGHTLLQCAILFTLLVLFKEVGAGNGTYFFEEANLPPDPCSPGELGCICKHNDAGIGTCLNTTSTECVFLAGSDTDGWCLSTLEPPLGARGSQCLGDEECLEPYDACLPAETFGEGAVGSNGVCLQRFSGSPAPSHGQTIIFNIFVWLQVFNEFNARILDNRISFLAGLNRNMIFWFIIVIICGVQALMTIWGGAITNTVPLTGLEWGGCLLFGSLELVWGIVVRLIPVPDNTNTGTGRAPSQLSEELAQKVGKEMPATAMKDVEDPPSLPTDSEKSHSSSRKRKKARSPRLPRGGPESPRLPPDGK